ncbi:hypothetical protein B0F90DRAFT_1816682 [Multifurca ochricompacta]|uniref:Uncharacterized protein n=1 Tax=Multifurca ochricompacta TaxID=376703 RepID=A0AAD4M4Z5_9AGAM|nr:hypothetical protein B0F90DRAFT_1816682 [Multifurca ochricompacta]
MSLHGRDRRRELVDEAYKLQGAVQYGSFSLASTLFAHRTWPAFRRQTLAFKGFLVSIFTIYGLVSGADAALLFHEHRQRLTENEVRREARIDLARRGLVATESQIIKWREEHKK